jgi:predicted Na+-dependent transporter
MILKERPNFSIPPNTILRRISDYIIHNKYTHYFMFLTILVDTIALLMYYDSATLSYSDNLNTVYHIITILFTLWVVFSLLAYGIQRYFDFSWRIYGFIIVLISLTDLILDLKYDWFHLYINSTSNTPNY